MCVPSARAKEHAMIHHAITNDGHVFSLARAKEHAMFRYGNAMLQLIIVSVSANKGFLWKAVGSTVNPKP